MPGEEKSEGFEEGLEAALGRHNKFCYVGAPAVFALEMECRVILEAFDSYGLYLVGSAIRRPDWRDVDLRMILSDEKFFELFPDAHDRGSWEFDPRWLLLTVSISERLSRLTGLPIDFQFQPQSHANKYHRGQRQAMGLRMAKRRAEPEPGLQPGQSGAPGAGEDGGSI